MGILVAYLLFFCINLDDDDDDDDDDDELFCGMVFISAGTNFIQRKT